MNGTSYASGQIIARGVDPNWKIVGAADFDGDTQTDILFQNQANGTVALWLMNGTSYSSGLIDGTGAWRSCARRSRPSKPRASGWRRFWRPCSRWRARMRVRSWQARRWPASMRSSRGAWNAPGAVRSKAVGRLCSSNASARMPSSREIQCCFPARSRICSTTPSATPVVA